MSWTRVWIHAVFTTKNRAKLIHQNFRQDLFDHIKMNAKEKNLLLREVGGYIDHAHCLIALNKEISISKTIQLIKGKSSYWINKNQLSKEKFGWQDDYWAVSVSESHLKSVERYIKSQEEHHKSKTFNEEINLFIEKYYWGKSNDQSEI